MAALSANMARITFGSVTPIPSKTFWKPPIVSGKYRRDGRNIPLKKRSPESGGSSFHTRFGNFNLELVDRRGARHQCFQLILIFRIHCLLAAASGLLRQVVLGGELSQKRILPRQVVWNHSFW